MRRAAKQLAETLLTTAGVPRWLRKRHRSDAVILAYHNVTPDGAPPAGDRSLHLPVARFVQQVEWIARTHEVVPLSELLRPDAAGRARPRAAVTFDDAYAGALELGIPELTRRGIPATLFVAPGLLDGRTFWWDRLADVETGALPAPLRETSLAEAQGREGEILARFGAHAGDGSSLPWTHRSASEEALLGVSREPGVHVGSHTWSHPNLAVLPREEIREELVRARAWIDERIPGQPRWLAYPYGLFSPDAEATLDEMDEAGCTLEGGYAHSGTADGKRTRVPRVNIPAGLSRRGFDLLTSGWKLR